MTLQERLVELNSVIGSSDLSRAAALRERDQIIRDADNDIAELAHILGVTSHRIRQIKSGSAPTTRLVEDLQKGDELRRPGGGIPRVVLLNEDLDPFKGYHRVTFSGGDYAIYPQGASVELETP